ncbi:MAG: heme ABC exporter ATP-binding protein CcmA [Acidobacteriota bacterium]
MTQPEGLVADNLSRAYGYVYALKEVSLTVRAGEAVGVFGPNGAGKSTLLRIAAGLLRPSSGTVRVFGGDLWETLGLRGKVGFLSHAIGLYPNLTVRENLSFFAELAGVGAASRRADDVIVRLELDRYASTEVRHLSRGWQQRAAIARGLLADPRLLLWDEPFSGLDEKTCEMVSRLLAEFKSEGRTALVASHEFDRTMTVCERAVVIDRGRLAFDGHGAEASDAYRRIIGVAKSAA